MKVANSATPPHRNILERQGNYSICHKVQSIQLVANSDKKTLAFLTFYRAPKKAPRDAN